ncbi:MAG: sigma-70 family RNA polymerase sigma factor, partial [Verrucomicrobiae bacterium]|nr:sigma-70 family RNA polymerase sigma factor [Verrucomicrobiae bacterium]
MTRASLLGRLQDLENRHAWEEFVEIYTPLIYGFSRNRGLREADAADVAQEVMRAVARHMPDFRYQPDKGAFRSWLFTVTRNKFNNFLAAWRRHPQGTGETAVQELLEAVPCPEQDDRWGREYQERMFEWACDQV